MQRSTERIITTQVGSLPRPIDLRQLWDDRLAGYDFGPEHPLAPVRVELTIALARAFGLLDAPGVSVAGPEPATQTERNLAVDAVTDALLALPFPQRAVIVLHHFEGLPYAEIASVTGSTESAVRSHLFRARRALGKKLEEWR